MTNDVTEQPAEQSGPRQILVADDDQMVRELLSRKLGRMGYQVHAEEDGEKALEAFRHHTVDLVLSDVRMPGLDGLSLLRAIKEINPRIPVIMISGEADTPMVVACLKAGAENFVTKPLDITALAQAIEQTFTRRCLVGSGIRSVPPTSQSTSFTVPSQSEYICDLIEEIGTSADAVGYSYQGIDNNLKMAIFEAVTNAMEHGNNWDPDKFVHVAVDVRKESLQVTIEDQGRGFDEACLADPTSAECLLSERGRGVFLMRAIMDEVVFGNSGSRVTMTKQRSN